MLNLMIKKMVFGLLMGILFLNSLSFVSAYWVDDVFDVLVPTSDVVYSDLSLWFVKILMGILVLAFIFFSLKKTKVLGDNFGIQLLLSVVIALIFVRYVSIGQIEGIIFAYKSLGLVILLGLVFLLIVYLVYREVNVSAMRRLLVFGFWIVYSIFSIGRVGFDVFWNSEVSLIFTLITAFVIIFDGLVKKTVDQSNG